PVLLQGVFLATGAILLFFVAKRFVEHDLAAYFAVFLFTLSTPVITGSLVVIAGLQPIIPLLICLSLLLYWSFIESTHLRKFILGGLCLVLTIGPWFREFLGIMPLLIIVFEFVRTRKFTWLMGLGLLFLLHAVFPM